MASFTIGLGKKDQALLELVKSYFGVGVIYDTHSANVSQFRVQLVKDLDVIIKHFEKYPLVSKKREDYILFREVLEIIKSKDHLTSKGFIKLLSLKNSMNLGLSLELKQKFPDLEQIARTEVKGIVVHNPQ